MKKLTIETLNALRDEQKKVMEVRITTDDIINSNKVIGSKINSSKQDKE